MVSQAVLGALSIYFAVAAAAPTTSTTKGFTVNQVAVPKSSYRAPAAAYARALSKFGATVPAHVAAAAAATGSATTNPSDGDEEWVTQVTVGQDTLNLDFDTGSSDL